MVGENKHTTEIGAQLILGVKGHTYAQRRRWRWRRLNVGRVLALDPPTSKTKEVTRAAMARCMSSTCCATTDSTAR
jgi:hypothetical protein